MFARDPRGRFALALALSFAGACSSRHGHKPPTNAECQAYRDKMFSFMPEADKAKYAAVGLGALTPTELALCQQRMQPDEITCIVAAKTLDEAMACKPAVDDRPAEMKRSPAECESFATHVKQLADKPSDGPPFTPYAATLMARECGHWLSKDRYDCVMKAPTSFALLACPP